MAMTKTFRRFVLALVVLVAMTVIGCGKNNPFGPSQLPDQSQYPVLPHRECAKNLETGEELPGCRMWAELQPGIKPPRGSTIKLGSQYCPQPDAPWSCLEFDVRFGFKEFDPRFVGMGMTGYWSSDGKTPGTQIFLRGMGTNEWSGHFGPWIFQEVPRYLLIRLQHAAGNSGNACDPTAGCDPALDGWVLFFLDYKG